MSSGFRMVGTRRSTFRHHSYTDYCLIKTAIMRAIYNGRITPDILPPHDSINWRIPSFYELRRVSSHPLMDTRVISEMKDLSHPSRELWIELQKTTEYFITMAKTKLPDTEGYVSDSSLEYDIPLSVSSSSSVSEEDGENEKNERQDTTYHP